MNHLEFKISLAPFYPASEILVAKLGEIGFESFVEDEPYILAYILKSDFNDFNLTQVLNEMESFSKIKIEKKEIPKENWNKRWENSFEPITLGDFCIIRAPFHSSNPNIKHEIIIEPKMSFGTGHHETTQLMIELMKGIDFADKKVLDMGSGTGILAILAEQLGAKSILAIDIEEWAFENMNENLERNNCSRIKTKLGGEEQLPEDENYDIILANINKNILKSQFETYAKLQLANQRMLISGFFQTDLKELSNRLQDYNYALEISIVENLWTSALFVKG